MTLDLTDDGTRALIALLRETLEYARFPLVPVCKKLRRMALCVLAAAANHPKAYEGGAEQR